MAIEANDLIGKAESATEVINVAGAVITTDNWSDSGDATTYTNSHDAKTAIAVLDATLSANPAAGGSIGLYARLLDISDTTEDANEPSDDFPHMPLGWFPVDSGDTVQRVPIEIPLPFFKTSTQMDFYLKNGTSVSINTGSTVDIYPTSVGPHP